METRKVNRIDELEEERILTKLEKKIEKIKFKKRLTKKEKLLLALNNLSGGGDVECQHGEADYLIIEYIGDEEIKEAYHNIEKWYA